MRCPQCKTPHDCLATTCDACGLAIAAAPVRPREPHPEGEPKAARPVRSRTGELRGRVPAAPATTHAVAFTGEGRALVGLHLINLFKTLLTAFVYHFWAKVAIRKYLYAHTAFHGDRFGYHGDGKELLVGWLKVAGIFLAIGGTTTYMQYGLKWTLAGLAGQLLAGLVSLLLLPVAIIGANRYRLSRTSWRGIRFSFRGRVKAFAPLCAKGLVFSLLTLGLYQPFFQAEVRRYLAEHTYFGTARFGFDGDPRALLGPYVIAMLLWLPTGGLVWFWYRARRDRLLWNHTTFHGARFACSVTAVGLWKLTAGNLAIMILTLGLGRPWAEIRRLRYMCANLALVGPLDVDRIHQAAQAATAAGEGLTDFLDTGFFEIEVGI
jgi:uncharacterized membrane protein YjgN (DUF898 family)